MLKRRIIGLLFITLIATLVTDAEAVICPGGRFNCQLDSDTQLETCRYAACGGSCCCVPGSIQIQMSANQLNSNHEGDTIHAIVTGLPGQNLLPAVVVCANSAGNDPWGTKVVAISSSVTLTGEAEDVNVTAGTTAATFKATVDDATLLQLTNDGACGPAHVVVDVIPLSFTLILSIINADGTVNSQGSNSIAAACVHPDPNSVGLVTKGPNKGGITGGAYECKLCPFVDANSDGIADVEGCASCVNPDGSLNDACADLGK
jgi:hypothetical protein